ncbi:MAG TPA: dihydrolipoyl dehydrogenase [Lichenihabitans sp.]|jgi:dihydrolipoamide dehydrogenase|nr:dihydrolipoyl dehydrogenase [Lichenihabitans sp.]
MSYDLVVIGTGPGGYVCAIRAAQLGLKTAVVEKRATYGGTCLNVGCIPSKALLYASEMYAAAGHDFSALGIKTAAPELDWSAMGRHRDDTVAANVNGVAFLFKKNKVDTFRGTGRIAAAGRVEVKADDGKTETIETKAIVIATGSEASTLPGVAIDETTIVSSTGALVLPAVPKRMVVIGAGVIGLELGSVWQRLGAEVEVVEFLDRILPGIDGEIARQFQRMLEKQGLTFHLGQKVSGVAARGDGATVSFAPVAGGDARTLDADVVLVATGRRAVTDGLGLDEAGVATERGRVVIDDHFATNVPGIYAIGDVVRGPMLAHKAEDEGIAVAEILAGQAGHVSYGVIPSVIYTMPEVAAVGATEEELEAAGTPYRVGKFPYTANGRARAMRHTDGFVKVLAHAETDRVLGVHMISAVAGELIQEASVLMEFGGSAEDLARTCHAHPTMSEAVKEAAMAVDKRAIHV